jgi:flagellar hook-associated protein 2
MTVSEDVTPAVRNVSDLVTAYNRLNATLSDLTAFKWDETLQKRVAQPFQGDASVLSLINVMRGVVGSASLGATSQYLSDVGLQMGKDGSLTINNAKLTVAANNGTSMQKLFTNDNGNALTNGFALKFKAVGKGLLAAGSSGTKGLQPGQGVVTAKAAKLQSDLDLNEAAQKKVTDRAADVEIQLSKRYSALDGQMGRLTAINAYVTQQITLWNKNTA